MRGKNYILWSSEMLLPAALLSVYWQEGRSQENDRKREREREMFKLPSLKSHKND